MIRSEVNIAILLCSLVMLMSLASRLSAQDSSIPQVQADILRQAQACVDQLKPLPSELTQTSRISLIKISGTTYTKEAFVRRALPFREGDFFDRGLSRQAIMAVYNLGTFKNVTLKGSLIDKKDLVLEVIVEERPPLIGVSFKGNTVIKTKTLEEKLGIAKIQSIDDEIAARLVEEIKNLYKHENYHNAQVTYTIAPDTKQPDKARITFTIIQGSSARVLKVAFVGNHHIASRKIRKILMTQEKWILGFLGHAGSYKEEFIEIDKHNIEFLYRDCGYLMAKVTDVDVAFDENGADIIVTFFIKEGEQFTMRKINAQSDDVFLESELMPLISLEEGKPYCQSKMIDSMNRLRDAWSEQGYVNADVYPQVVPHEETHSVDVSFHTERGNRLHANRIAITGNKVTRDKVIRRQLEIVEGERITERKLQASKNNVLRLSYFDRDGANWVFHPINDELADLELRIKETKTGSFNFQMSFGSDKDDAKSSLKGCINLEKGNLFGNGIDVGGMVQANRHRFKKFEAHVSNPHLFDSDVYGGANIYKNVDEYEQWKTLKPSPIQEVFGMTGKLGFAFPHFDKHLHAFFEFGVEKIENNNPKLADAKAHENLAPVINRIFEKGMFAWLGFDLVKDTRNHQVYPNKGYKVTLSSKLAPPAFSDQYSFFKGEVQASCYNALIGLDTLVLGMQFKGGFIRKLDTMQNIPYKELFHMGGQSSVRGHVWGGIGPAWGDTRDPLGGRNFVQFNSELIFPISPDYAMKGHIFYDAGAGWNTPKEDIPDISKIIRDRFDVRHTIGVGLNLSQPMPAKIDWGFKLDRRKNAGESPHEFHLTMNYAW